MLQYRRELPRPAMPLESKAQFLDVVQMVFPLEIAETFKLSREDHHTHVKFDYSHPGMETGWQPTVIVFKCWRKRFMTYPTQVYYI